jgi:hypothetical protein
MRAIPLWQQQLLIAAIVSLPLGTGLPVYAQENSTAIAVVKQSNKTMFKHVMHRNERAPVVRARPETEYSDRQRPRGILDVPVNQVVDRTPRNNSQNNVPGARNITNNQPRSIINNTEAQPFGRANAQSIINGNTNNNSDAERSQRGSTFDMQNNTMLKRSQR